MTIEDTIKVLLNERACVMRQAGPGCDRNCADCDLVLPDELVLSAYWTAVKILRAHQEAEENKPLTMEELRKMDGQPVYVTQPGHESCWALVYGFWAAQGIIYLTYFNGATDLVEVILNNGAKIYRRPPKEVQA